MKLGTTSVELAEVAKFVRGITFKPNDVVPVGSPDSVSCMRTKNVQAELDSTDVWAVSSRLVKRPEQFLRTGDVLVSSANSWNLVGKCCWVPELGAEATFGGFTSVLRADQSKVDPRYLYRWFSSHPIQAQVRGFGRQTTNISNLDFNRCLKLRLPTPPISEQRRIVEALEGVEAMRDQRHRAISLLDDLAQATFNELFGDVVQNDLRWDDSSTLGDMAIISSGITKGRRPPSLPMRPVPYMAVANVQDKALDMSVVKEIDVTEAEARRYALVAGDLLLTEGGDPDKLGRGTLWRDELPECIHQNHIFRVRVNPGVPLSSVFLNWLVASERGRNYFLRSAKQTTGIASINMSQLRQFPILIPPMDLQNRFAAHLDLIDNSRSVQLQHLAELDALFAAVQYRAFRGELWDDPPD